MSLSITLLRRNLAVWLLAFTGPTVYFLVLLLAERAGVAPPPEQFVILWFCLVALVALVVCQSVVWVSTRPVARRLGWMLFTLLAMVVQCGAIAAIVLMATGYAQ
jgi:hypothetical protein